MVKGGLRGAVGCEAPPGGGYGKPAVVSGACDSGNALLIPDLKDMSLMTLSTKTPQDFFTRHTLVLHVARSEMDKVRVFQATRKSSPSVFPPCPGQWGTLLSHSCVAGKS